LIEEISSSAAPILIQGLENNNNIEIPNLNKIVDIDKKRLGIVLVDGLSANIAGFLSKLYQKSGSTVKYIGGGAGTMDFIQKPVLFCRKGIFKNAALIAFVDVSSHLSVKHGWVEFKGPFVITKSNKNIISNINWDAAFDVYKEALLPNDAKKINRDNFYDIAKGYPFGIYREQEEYIVRDPLLMDDNNDIICVGEVPENTIIHILKGEKQNLIEAAGTAAQEALSANKEVNKVMMVDCVSRKLFLKNDYKEELQTVYNFVKKKDSKINLFGVLSLGEISSLESGALEFFNKTTVIGAINDSK
ncbi:MAG: FIST C-terminal domain-containing protein, partial [Bacteroidota bacterium]|nr:FIST C-terminal domain-containing protein [Bacteroidota bacterium]